MRLDVRPWKRSSVTLQTTEDGTKENQVPRGRVGNVTLQRKSWECNPSIKRSKRMGKAFVEFKEMRFVIEEELTQVYVLAQASGDAPM